MSDNQPTEDMIMSYDEIDTWVTPHTPDAVKHILRVIVSLKDQLDSMPIKADDVDCDHNNIRSKPGKGEDVYIATVIPASVFGFFDEGPEYYFSTFYIGENFAESSLPIVIKIQPGTNKWFVVETLRKYANDVAAMEGDVFACTGKTLESPDVFGFPL